MLWKEAKHDDAIAQMLELIPEVISKARDMRAALITHAHNRGEASPHS